MHYANNDLRRADEDFSRAIQNGTDSPEVYFYRGVGRYELGQFAEAITDFDTALRAQPEEASRYYYRRALAQHQLGQWRKAIGDYQRVLSVWTHHEGAQYHLQLAQALRRPESIQPVAERTDSELSQASMGW